jgi:hypothetical protein
MLLTEGTSPVRVGVSQEGGVTMGWLDALCGEFGLDYSGPRLAAALMASERWETDSRIKQDSLSSKLNTLNAGQQLQWLEKRQWVLEALADVLECPLADVRRALDQVILYEPGVSQRKSSEVDYLRDMPRVRLDWKELNLVPPWLPAPLLNFPQEASRIWWCAHSGEGRTLAGHWFKAHRRVAIMTDTNVDDLKGLPPNIPLFIDVNRLDILSDLLRLISNDLFRPICVVSPYRLNDESKISGSWLEVETPDVVLILDNLLIWIDYVIKKSKCETHFDLEKARTWLKKPEMDWVDSVETVMGLCGLLHEYDTKTIFKNKDQHPVVNHATWAELHTRATMRTLSEEGNTSAEALKPTIEELLRGMAQRHIDACASVWHAGWKRQDWTRLIPDELSQPTNVEGVLALLDTYKKDSVLIKELRKDFKERLATPGQTIHLMENVGLLRPVIEDELGMRPAWVWDAIINNELRHCLSQKTSRWAHLLTRTHQAEDLLEWICEEFLSDDEHRLHEVLIMDMETIEAVAATEGVFRALGIAILLGAKPSLEAASKLWDRQHQLIFWKNNNFPDPAMGFYGSRDSSWVDYGIWYLAVLAYTEYLWKNDRLSKDTHELLAPWLVDTPPEGLENNLMQIPHVDKMRGEWVEPTFSLARRLFERHGDQVAKRTRSIYAIDWQAGLPVITAILNNQALLWKDIAAFEGFRCGHEHNEGIAIPCVIDEVKRRGMDWSDVASKIMDVALQQPNLPYFLSKGSYREDFWPHASPHAVTYKIEHHSWSNFPWELIKKRHWQEITEFFIKKYKESQGSKNFIYQYTHSLDIWMHIPEEHALELIRSGVFSWNDKQPMEIFFKRFSEPTFHELIGMLNKHNFKEAIQLLSNTTPNEYYPLIIDTLESSLEIIIEDKDRKLDSLNYLHFMISKRVPEWERAFALWRKLNFM